MVLNPPSTQVRTVSLGLHDFSEVEKLPNVRYRRCWEPQQIAAMVGDGQAI
jgi:hypothetical protein